MNECRAFSDLFRKFLVPMKLGKNCDFGKNTTIMGKNSAFFSKIGKVYLLNWDFSANWEYSRSIGNFFSQLGKNLVQSEFFITVNAITEYSTSDKNFVGTDFSLLKLLRYNGKHAYRHRQ